MDDKAMEWMQDHCACEEACEWLETQPDLQTAWANCNRSDWMQWLLKKLGLWQGPASAQYEAIWGPAWAQYRAIREQAWAQYEAIRDQAWAQYEAIEKQAWAQYQAICVDAIRRLWPCPDLT